MKLVQFTLSNTWSGGRGRLTWEHLCQHMFCKVSSRFLVRGFLSWFAARPTALCPFSPECTTLTTPTHWNKQQYFTLATWLAYLVAMLPLLHARLSFCLTPVWSSELQPDSLPVLWVCLEKIFCPLWDEFLVNYSPCCSSPFAATKPHNSHVFAIIPPQSLPTPSLQNKSIFFKKWNIVPSVLL